MFDLKRSRRRHARKRRIVTLGVPPGTLIADPEAPKPVIRLMAYSSDAHIEVTITNPEEIIEHLSKWPITWINVDGLGDASIIARLGEIFDLHRLALEDVMNTHQRAKVEAYKDHLYIVCREIEYENGVASDQISMFLGKNFVLTFQEHAGDCLGSVRERIRQSDRFRSYGADYLAYALLDAVIDGYFPALENMGENLEALEEKVVLSPTEDMVPRIHMLKRELLTVRRAIWPARDAINSLLRDPNPLVSDHTRLYLRDCHDHVIHVIDMLETYRELGSDLMDIYLSSLSNRLNSVMKVLTIIATIFMPLSFIASLYGMNFDRSHPLNMPELGWKYGYLTVLIFMLLSAAGMMYYFYRQGWLSRSRVTRASLEDAGKPPPNV